MPDKSDFGLNEGHKTTRGGERVLIRPVRPEDAALYRDFLADVSAEDLRLRFFARVATRMHVFTHLKKSSQGKTGFGLYPDGMVEHDGHVGELLKLVDDLGVADNTIIVYTTDNGAEVFTWPDGGSTPFKGEKSTNWEGGFRVPCLIKWPGVIKPGTIVNDVCSHEDFIPTFAAAAGDPN